MWSLKNTLGLISSNLPAGFSAKNGVKSLLPPKYKGTLGVLSAYVFTRTGKASIDEWDWATYFVAADGGGRWFFSWTGYPYDLGHWPESIPDANIRLQAGFVFLYTNDGVARGFIDTSRPSTYSLSCASGADPWIAENWPNLFTSTVFCGYQQAAGFDSLPPESNIWQNAGFPQANFAALSGGNVPSSGGASGSTLFPADEQNIYCVLEVRDPSLIESLHLPADQFWQQWAQAQPSKQTIETLTQYVNLRYLSPDWRTAVISGSARSLGAQPCVSARLTVFGWQPTLSGASDNITAGAANMFGGALAIITSPGASLAGPEGPPVVAAIGCAWTQEGFNQVIFGLVEGAYVIGSQLIGGGGGSSSTPITTPATPANPSGAQIYGASQGNTGGSGSGSGGGGTGSGSGGGSGDQQDSQPTSEPYGPPLLIGEIDAAGNWMWYLDFDGTTVYNIDSSPICGPGDVPNAAGTGIGGTGAPGDGGGADEPFPP